MIIGIDPGAQGAIVFLNDLGGIVSCHEMPIWINKVKLSKPKKTKSGKITTHRNETNIAVKRLKDLFKDVVPYEKQWRGCKIYCEQLKDIFGISSQNNFQMGVNYGMVQSVLDQVFGDYYLVRPQEWTKRIWIEKDIIKKDNNRNDTKATSLNAARRLFPNESFLATSRSKVAHDGMVDAALIALYGSLL